jgi:hypothetical protein
MPGFLFLFWIIAPGPVGTAIGRTNCKNSRIRALHPRIVAPGRSELRSRG